jgi:rare lipoprotein A
MYRVATLALGFLLGFVLIEAAVADHVRATWYGHELAGRKTASGQVFKPYGMTAAHRTLPFGTCLLVSNPRTGKSVRVTVNDRGPFTKGISLDLSLGAARAIGMRSTQTVSMNRC